MVATVQLSHPARAVQDITTYQPREADIFGSLQKTTGIVGSYTHKVHPSVPLSERNISFHFAPDFLHYILASKVRMYVRFKVMNGDAPIDNDDNVSFLNLLPAALFKSVQLEVGDLAAGGADPLTLAYKTILEYASTFDYGARYTHLTNALYYEDEAGRAEDMNLTQDLAAKKYTNQGYLNRRSLIQGGKACEFIFPLNLDVLNVDNYFPPGLKITLTFTRNDDKWCLLSPEANPKYTIKLEEMYLAFEKLQLDPVITREHEQAMFRGAYARYGYKRNVIKKKTLVATERSFFWQNLFSGTLPSQVFMVMVDTAADQGAYNKNPFRFQHFGIKRASLTLDGREVQTFDTDFDNHKYLEVLQAFYENIGIQDQNGGCGISRSHFLTDKYVTSWNLIPDKRDAYLERYGAMDLHLQFKEALTQGITVIVWGIFDEILRITPDKRMEKASG